jgi:cytochrome c oxidase cbb3-type subunit III
MRGPLPELTASVALALLLAGCGDAIPRRAEVPPPPGTIGDARQGSLQAGPDLRQVRISNPYDGDSRAINHGQQLFNWFNCTGCHGGYGGGGIGPPLVNGERNPARDFDFIYSGREAGMPAYGGRIPDDQIWRIVAYIQALQREEIFVPEAQGEPAPAAGSHVARGSP